MSDRLNPILVREARIMVRSRWIVLMIVLYQLILVAAVGVALFVILAQSKPETVATRLFSAISLVTWNVTVIAVTVYTGWRMATDRINEDLLFYSTITPSQNIRGRLACGFVLSVLFYSMSLPYLSVTYLLRGIDIWPFFLWLPVNLLKITILNLVAVAVFSAVRSWMQLFFYALLFLCLAEPLNNLAMAGTAALYNWSSSPSSTVGWPITVFGYPVHFFRTDLATIFALGILSGFMFFFVPVSAFLFARCNLSPYSTNRMMPIRRWFSWLLGVSLVVSFSYWQFVTVSSYDRVPILSSWLAFAVGLLSFMLVLAVCERETWEGRLRRAIPQAVGDRVRVFPLFTGSVNGLLWVFLWTFFLAVVISASVLFILARWNNTNYSSYSSSFIGGEMLALFRHLVFLMLVFDYSMTAFFLWKTLLRRWVPREMIWTLTLGLMAAAAVGSYLAAFCLQETFHVSDDLALLAPNPLSVYLGEDFQYPLLFGLGWFIVVVILGYPWLRGRFLDFTPVEEPKP